MPFKITTCSQFQAKAQEAKRDNKHILINWTSSRCWVCTDVAEPACAKLEASHPNIVFLDLVHGDFFKAILPGMFMLVPASIADGDARLPPTIHKDLKGTPTFQLLTPDLESVVVAEGWDGDEEFAQLLDKASRAA